MSSRSSGRRDQMRRFIVWWWRRLTEESGRGRLRGFGGDGFRVRYDDGMVSERMAYDIASDYAEMFGGTVILHEEGGV